MAAPVPEIEVGAAGQVEVGHFEPLHGRVEHFRRPFGKADDKLGRVESGDGVDLGASEVLGVFSGHCDSIWSDLKTDSNSEERLGDKNFDRRDVVIVADVTDDVDCRHGDAILIAPDQPEILHTGDFVSRPINLKMRIRLKPDVSRFGRTSNQILLQNLVCPIIIFKGNNVVC